ncbi:MAG: hypothetical protein K0U98_12130 [Deltaproteobacteria bacterium]|nr:hypothetical protein [Deltaproteobacteria bacterium]
MSRRSIIITINNNTASTLTLGNIDRTHGTDPVCTNPIYNASSGTISAEDAKNYGPVATVQYMVADTGGIYTISYNKPMTTGDTVVTVTPPTGYGYKCIASDLQQKHSTCTYEFTNNPADASTCTS